MFYILLFLDLILFSPHPKLAHATLSQTEKKQDWNRLQTCLCKSKRDPSTCELLVSSPDTLSASVTRLKRVLCEDIGTSVVTCSTLRLEDSNCCCVRVEMLSFLCKVQQRSVGCQLCFYAWLPPSAPVSAPSLTSDTCLCLTHMLKSQTLTSDWSASTFKCKFSKTEALIITTSFQSVVPAV